VVGVLLHRIELACLGTAPAVERVPVDRHVGDRAPRLDDAQPAAGAVDVHELARLQRLEHRQRALPAAEARRQRVELHDRTPLDRPAAARQSARSSSSSMGSPISRLMRSGVASSRRYTRDGDSVRCAPRQPSTAHARRSRPRAG
jgi:hypothetical protein